MSASQDSQNLVHELSERLAASCPEMARVLRAHMALDDHMVWGGFFSLFPELIPESTAGGSHREEYLALNGDAANALAELAKMLGCASPADMAYLLDRAIESCAARLGAEDLYQAWHKLRSVLESLDHGGILNDQRILDSALADAAAVLKQPLEDLAREDSEEDRAPGACAAKADRILAVGRTEDTRQL